MQGMPYGSFCSLKSPLDPLRAINTNQPFATLDLDFLLLSRQHRLTTPEKASPTSRRSFRVPLLASGTRDHGISRGE